MDSHILATSMSPEGGNSLLFENKQWIEIPDSNSGVYSSGRVTFNLDSVSNSNDSYFNAQQTYIQIPLNLAVEIKNTTAAAVATPFAAANSIAANFVASLKAGSFHLIDKINFKMNQNEVITNDQFENVKINYKILTSWSADDVVKRGDELHYAKDSVDSFSYTANTGAGLYNNKVNEVSLFQANSGFQAEANYGRKQRMKKTSRCQRALSTAIQGLTDDDELKTRYMDNVVVTDSDASTTATINYTILAQIRLADLHPFFAKMPLVRNAAMYLALTLNVNAIHTIGITNGVYAGQFAVTNQTNTTPYMLSSCGVTAAAAEIYLKDCSATLKSCISVRQVPTTIIAGSAPHALSQCLFQACYVKMNPTYQIEYARNPTKDIVYEECYCQQISNIPVGQVVSQLISGTYSRLRKVVVMPFLSTASNHNVSPLVSCLTSEPATCSPYVCIPAISNYNVRIGINNVYPRNMQYGWENYLQEVQGDGAIHGGIDAGLNCGLLSQREWETAYGYRVTNLSRKVELQDLAGSQITVQFTNQAKKIMDYLVFVYYEKHFSIEAEKGLVVL